MSLALRIESKERLVRHVCGQLSMFYPLSVLENDIHSISLFVEESLSRMAVIVNSVRNFKQGYFDHLNTLQYASFIYILGNTICKSKDNKKLNEDEKSDLVDRLFGLNRAVSGLEIYPSTSLPEPFFLSHALGTILGNVQYGRGLVIFHNVTVGRIGENRPSVGDDVILFPGSSVTGRSTIGAGSVISANTHLHNVHIPEKSLVFSGNGKISIKNLDRDYLSLYFR
ncbi:hypothetical protein [uncultured Sphingomonas sp.]|uniref:hypothetical protein n=1 Tax=uncultured Sphingomonas sp. TaxID=158754 RepID=UPI00262D954C|nr:hypothetical protein [uncultured Sphingomonas sp.]